MPALRSDALSGFAHEAGRIADTLEIGVGGYIIFGGTSESVRRLTADLLRRAGRPLLLASDLERGAGQQVAGLTEFPPPMALASLRDPAVVRWAACGHGPGGPGGRDQLGLCPGRGSRSPAGKPDRADPRLRRRSE